MTTAAPSTLTSPGSRDRPWFVFEDVDWDFYETVLLKVGERNVRVTFDGKDLELMSPLPEHESYKASLRRLFEVLLEELNVPFVPRGSMTLKVGEKQVGLEPDECYYIQNYARIRRPTQPDLSVDPPPDLAIEIDVTSRSVGRLPIYAAIGIPEVWRYIDGRLIALRLEADGRYAQVDSSLALPFLRVAELEPFIRLGSEEDHISLTRAFREWVRANLIQYRKA